MSKATQTIWLLRTAVALFLLIGLLPVYNVLSNQNMHMEMMPEGGTLYSTASTHGDVSMPCCDVKVCSFFSMCSFVVPNSAFATQFVGTHRVAPLYDFVHRTYLEITTPPPKI